jgi:hypothetical protein
VEENTTVVNAEPTPATEAPKEPVAEPTAPVTPEPEPQEPKESRASKRIGQLVAEREYLKGVISQIQKEPAPVITDIKTPTVDQFESYDDFLVAKAKYEIRADQIANEQRTKLDAFNATFTERINRAAEKDPEILEIVNDRTLPISVAMSYVIKESDSAPELLKYLADHRDESFKLSRMTPGAAAREIGKIEYRLSNQPKPEIKKVSQAPEPIKPVEPKGPQSVELDKIAMDDFVKRRNQEQFGTKRR